MQLRQTLFYPFCLLDRLRVLSSQLGYFLALAHARQCVRQPSGLDSVVRDYRRAGRKPLDFGLQRIGVQLAQNLVQQQKGGIAFSVATFGGGALPCADSARRLLDTVCHLRTARKTRGNSGGSAQHRPLFGAVLYLRPRSRLADVAVGRKPDDSADPFCGNARKHAAGKHLGR